MTISKETLDELLEGVMRPCMRTAVRKSATVAAG
jgi:hypothetical protein